MVTEHKNSNCKDPLDLARLFHHRQGLRWPRRQRVPIHHTAVVLSQDNEKVESVLPGEAYYLDMPFRYGSKTLLYWSDCFSVRFDIPVRLGAEEFWAQVLVDLEFSDPSGLAHFVETHSPNIKDEHLLRTFELVDEIRKKDPASIERNNGYDDCSVVDTEFIRSYFRDYPVQIKGGVCEHLIRKSTTEWNAESSVLETSERIIPYVLDAAGHPYELKPEHPLTLLVKLVALAQKSVFAVLGLLLITSSLISLWGWSLPINRFEDAKIWVTTAAFLALVAAELFKRYENSKIKVSRLNSFFSNYHDSYTLPGKQEKTFWERISILAGKGEFDTPSKAKKQLGWLKGQFGAFDWFDNTVEKVLGDIYDDQPFIYNRTMVLTRSLFNWYRPPESMEWENQLKELQKEVRKHIIAYGILAPRQQSLHHRFWFWLRANSRVWHLRNKLSDLTWFLCSFRIVRLQRPSLRSWWYVRNRLSSVVYALRRLLGGILGKPWRTALLLVVVLLGYTISQQPFIRAEVSNIAEEAWQATQPMVCSTMQNVKCPLLGDNAKHFCFWESRGICPEDIVILIPTPTPTPTLTSVPISTPTHETAEKSTTTATQAVHTKPVPTSTYTPKPPATPNLLKAPVCANEYAIITSPLEGSRHTGDVKIIGTAQHEQFDFYKLEWTNDAPSAEKRSWHAGKPFEIPNENSSVVDGELGTFKLAYVPSGKIYIRLTVVENTGNYPAPCETFIIKP